MLVAAQRPELFGPIIVAGSPLSYWAGVHGENPMRYTAGLLGGSWLTALTGDIGNGKFDGAWLVSNFENLNPANTLWSKQHNLYAKVDSEAPRYLEFEQWWGGHVLLNAEEMQFIADELFIGNKLASGEIASSDGTRFDLRNIASPSSSSARRPTTSPRRRRRSIGSSNFTKAWRTSAPTARPSSIRCIPRSGISGFSSQGR